VEVVSQPRGLRLGVAAAIVFLGLLFFFASAAPFDSLGVRGAGVLVATIAASRALLLGIRANRNEIVIRNFLRTHRLRWEDVHQIGIGESWRRGATNLMFITKDARVVPATATTNRRREQLRVMQGLAELRPDLPIQYFEAG
jgi:Bacterial PH domain